ncbi:MAG: hypothetical protein RBS16_08900 [Candidatus Cloacimonadales bacterium]|jgi:hypothetical protein|nr:hypothetical protein [Candidatus Cloacimonadota bacterium]MDX9978128.1 hypothetical protein [Candidatus Cloacimonadales bacterium]
MKKAFILLLFIALLISIVFANEEFRVSDFPNDDGSALLLEWDKSLLELGDIFVFKSYDNVEFNILSLESNLLQYVDSDTSFTESMVYYRLDVKNDDGELISSFESSAVPKAQWFNTDKLPLLIVLVVFSFAIIYFILSAKRGKNHYIRRITGLDSIEESVGRATEMGKPVLFVPGIMDLDDMQTIAGLTILGKLAEKTAEYHCKLIVPVSKSMVLSAAKEVVKTAYMQVGYPDEYKDDDIYYLTDDQFGYVAGLDGIIVREKPAANFLLGSFYAESLIVAETGFASGAIQTAGTAEPAQLPFFVASCDFTLIGEELFAASAYLSKDPQQLGSLKGQDFGKFVIILLIIIGVILEIFGYHFLKDFFTIS